MRNMLCLAVAAASIAAPAHAIIITNFASNRASSTIDILSTGPGLAAFDLTISGTSDNVITFQIEEADPDVIQFNSFISFLSTVRTLNLTTTDSTINPGSIVPAFSDFTVGGEDNNVRIQFLPAEFVSASLGDTGSGGDNFTLDIGGVPTGSTFELFITASRIGAVPAPAALALFGFGIIGVAAARRR